MTQMKKYLLKLLGLILSKLFLAQTLYAIDATAIPITEVILNTDGTQVIQTSSGQGGLNDANSNVPVNIESITVNDGGSSVILDNFATVDISINNITQDVYDRNWTIFSHNNGVRVGSTNSSFQSELETVLGTTDIRDYISNNDELNYIHMWDIIYNSFTVDSDDYMLYQERDGNSPFSLQPLDSSGNLLGQRVYFNAGDMTWDTGYDIGDGSNIDDYQNPIFGIIKVSQFDIGSNKIYGFRYWSQGSDSKFYALSPNTFAPPVTLTCTDIERSFSSPANSLGGSMMLNNNAKINGTINDEVNTQDWTNNGAICDSNPCVMSNTIVSPYSFAFDAGNGSDGWGSVNTTYSTNKSFEGMNLNTSDSITFENDIVVRFRNNFSPSGTININGNVTIYATGFNQNSGSHINVIGGSLTIIANDIVLDSASTITPSDLLCLANNQLTLNEGVILKGYLYSNGTLILNRNSIVNGAVTADNLIMNEDSTINYDVGGCESVGSPFSCSSESLLFTSEKLATYTEAYKINLSEGNVTIQKSFGTSHINATGYNIENNYVYGYEYGSSSIVKIDSNYKVEQLNIAGLPTAEYYLGDVSLDGIYYLANRDKDGENRIQEIQKVDISTQTLLPKITLQYPIDMKKILSADFAFNPKDNKIYTVNAVNNQLMRIDPNSGVVEELGYVGNIGNTYSVIDFFDKDGNFYFYTNESQKIYRIVISNPSNINPVATKFINMLNVATSGDGARCANASISAKPIIDISDSQVIEGHNGTKNIVFTVTSDRDIEYAEGLKLSYVLSDGSAKAGSDYNPYTGSFFMFAGTKTYNLSLPVIKGDKDIEGNEDFFIHFTTPVADKNATFLDKNNTAIGIIINDDFDIRINAMTQPSAGFDGNITTQIVNKNFDLIIKAYDFTRNIVISDMNITKIDIIDDTETISTWGLGAQTNVDGIAVATTSVNRALKIADIKIYADHNGTTYESIATDNFAVRPDRFTLSLPSTNKSGESFTIDIKAIDFANNPTSQYNESINTSFDINFTEKKPHCVIGNIDLSNIKFTNGEAIEDINYSEAGELDFNISEIAGREFALVDKDDTSDAQRYIIPATASSINFTAGYFTIDSWSLSNGAPSFTYYSDTSDIDEMHTELNATIKVYSATGTLLTNYDSMCYAKDTNLLVNYSIFGNTTNRLIWADKNNTQVHNGLGINGSFTFDIDRTRFEHGITKPVIYINFERDKTTPKNPLRLTITELNATDTDGISNNAIPITIKESDFYYGKMNTPDYSNSGKEHNITVYHEVYCKDCNKSIFNYANARESIDSIYWYILNNAQYTGGGKFTDIKSVNNPFNDNPDVFTSGHSNFIKINNEDLIEFKILKSPLKDRFIYSPSSWLIFNRFNSSADTNYCRINITSSAGWAGKGKQGGTTVDQDISRKGLRKMDW